LLAKGLLYKEIANNLFISQETVRKHVYHIYEKLHVNNRVEAINKFFGR
ncbi:MAG: LuxR family transcriptional regulator, partial [Chitinophagaceae bacterium]